jgi:hypothetical protein
VTDLGSTIRSSAGSADWAADWDEVLRRAGHSRFQTRRAAVIAALAAVAVVLALPGIGVGGGLNALFSESRPGVELRAVLTLAGGQDVGTVSLRASRIFVSLPRKGRPKEFFVPRGHRPVLPPVSMRWSLDLAGGKGADSAVVQGRHGKLITRLCAPCSDGAHGTLKLHPRELLSAFRATAVVKTSEGTARGILRLPTPVR